jgi:hypothetical protein
MNALQKAFTDFDAENPHVWKLFLRFTGEAMKAGHKHMGAKAIVERIRWETSVVTQSSDRFKINNNHTAYYVRKFKEALPQFADFFHVRRVEDDTCPST